jgi:hypothetical protein
VPLFLFMINLVQGLNTFIIYGDFTNYVNYRINLINGFDNVVHFSRLIYNTNNKRFTEFSFYVNDNVIANYHLNNLPFGNYDFRLINALNVIFHRGQAFLAGDNEIQTIEYISDNEKSESIIYVS